MWPKTISLHSAQPRQAKSDVSLREMQGKGFAICRDFQMDFSAGSGQCNLETKPVPKISDFYFYTTFRIASKHTNLHLKFFGIN